MSQATTQFVSKCKSFWDQADKDKSGSLTVGELAKVIRATSSIQMSDAEIAEMFRDMDDDKSKTLSWDEFSEVFTKKDPKLVQKSELKSACLEFDKDGSGLISPAEMKAQMKKLGISLSDEDFEKLMSDADKDGDGNINYDEFNKAW